MAFNLAAIALVLALAGLGVAYLIDGMTVEKRVLPSLRTAGPTVEMSIAGQKLAIPPPWFRDPDQRGESFSERIDLIFALPLAPGGRMAEIEVALMPRSKARSSALLLDAVYLHQFLPEQIQGPPGLVGKPLRKSEGFESETVWYDPLSATPFVAKCMQAVSADTGETCIRTVLIGNNVSATYRFDREVLAQWHRFDAEAEEWLRRIGGI